MMITEIKVLNRDTNEEQIMFKVDEMYGDISFSSREDAEKFMNDQMNMQPKQVQ